jgi:hypothetical protein
MIRAALLALVLLTSAACAARGIHPPLTGLCFDGQPMQVLVDPQCPGGVCGFSCLPNRWTKGAP